MSSSEIHHGPDDPTRLLRGWLWAGGLASIAMGTLAMIFPFAATLAAELLFGAILAVLGAFQVLRALFSEHAGSRFWTLLFGAVALVAGVALLVYPVSGAVTLTAVLAGFFIAGGALKIMSGLNLRGGNTVNGGLPAIDGWWWLVVSGVLSLVLGVLLLLGLPSTAIWAIGILIGIDLIFFGFSEIFVAMAIKRAGLH